MGEVLAALKLSDVANENLSTSRDSINAIAPSDIEQLETDIEDNVQRVIVPFAEVSYRALPNSNAAAIVGAMPLVNSQTCFVSGNSNMILNHMNDNFAVETPAYSATKSMKSKLKMALNIKQSRSKDLEKRKLSQNLDNFSLRLGQSIDTEAQRKTTEMLTQQTQAQQLQEKKAQQLKQSMHSTNDEKLSSELVIRFISTVNTLKDIFALSVTRRLVCCPAGTVATNLRARPLRTMSGWHFCIAPYRSCWTVNLTR